MKPARCSYVMFGLLSLGLAFLMGCGGSSEIKPKGKVHKSGKAIEVSEKGLIQMTFLAEDGKNRYSADVDKSGNFNVNGPAGKGIPAGKYTITVAVLDPYSVDAKDRLKDAFSEKNSKIVREVKSGQELDIDLDRP